MLKNKIDLAETPNKPYALEKNTLNQKQDSLIWDQKVAGSNPVAPTMYKVSNRAGFPRFLLFCAYYGFYRFTATLLQSCKNIVLMPCPC